ncbi:MAG: nitroreductase family protein [Bacteroidales bacterium]
MNAIYHRRTIRKFKKQPVENEKLKQLLEAAVMAPSAGNQQPWQFILITAREVLDQLSEATPNAKALKEAQAAIVVIGDLERETRQGFWVQDCTAATMNILLQAYESGLGSVWIGVYPREDRVQNVSAILGLPLYAIPLNIIGIGYPDEIKEQAVRFNEEIIHYDHW